MKINTVNNTYLIDNKTYKKTLSQPIKNIIDNDSYVKVSSPNFKSNPIKNLRGYVNYKLIEQRVKATAKEIESHPNGNKLAFRNLSMEALEGLQWGIKAFKGLSMKEIQYLCENLHVIAVKRGCNNMCGYCYADAKPSKREMSWEDFTTITDGFKEIRKRLHGLPIFGENMTEKFPDGLIYRTTELYYDADCMNLAIKDKKGNLHDFRELATKVYESTGRKTVFDTASWAPENKNLQKRAEDYAEYFSKLENMDKLNEFNLSFNTFNATYIAAIKALKAKNTELYNRLYEKYVDKIANAIFTFTPLLKENKFNIMMRTFSLDAVNAKHFDITAMLGLIKKVQDKLNILYEQDLNGVQKFVKTQEDKEKLLKLLEYKMASISTGLNSSGRMIEFMKSFNIKAPMQDHSESTEIMANDLKHLGRYHRYLAHKMIDTDGKVYHMDYARFFPTEIQLNIKDKSPTPKLANIRNDFVVTKDIINRPETLGTIDDFV